MRKTPKKEISLMIEELFQKADEISKKDETIAAKIVKKARRIAKRNNYSLKNYKKRFCNKCNTYFVFGKNCSVRLSKGKVLLKCLKCGNVKRYVYKE